MSIPAAEQWRFGGAPANSTTHTRIIDVALPAGFPLSQEQGLSVSAPQNVPAASFDALSPDDFGQLLMLTANWNSGASRRAGFSLRGAPANEFAG